MKSIIRENAEKDPNYAPYCGGCDRLHRMTKVEPFLWNHYCGAVHDERQPMENRRRFSKAEVLEAAGRASEKPETDVPSEPHVVVDGLLPAAKPDDYCMVESMSGYNCTRPKGHEPDAHAAHGCDDEGRVLPAPLHIWTERSCRYPA
jgi:hypothetical protein